MSAIDRIFAAQRAHKWSVKNSSAAERCGKLERLKAAVLAHGPQIRRALYEDLRKPEAEAAGEIGSVENDINDALHNLDTWMAPVEITPAPAFQGARARMVYEARGLCLVFGPWNFPFQLLFEPPSVEEGFDEVLAVHET